MKGPSKTQAGMCLPWRGCNSHTLPRSCGVPVSRHRPLDSQWAQEQVLPSVSADTCLHPHFLAPPLQPSRWPGLIAPATHFSGSSFCSSRLGILPRHQSLKHALLPPFSSLFTHFQDRLHCLPALLFSSAVRLLRSHRKLPGTADLWLLASDPH